LKYFIIAGEPSGDLHGGNLVKQLYIQDKNAVVTAWGGDKMADAGAKLVKHIKTLAFMGFVEVLRNLGTIFSNFKECKKSIIEANPDVLILIDYPGFNLRMAAWAKSQNLKVVYYISPKVWAWKENRVKKIKKYVDKMICILPFEKEFYKKWDYEIDYVGNPILDEVIKFKHSNTILEKGNKIIALLPGSRKQEISKILPVMLTVLDEFKEYTFVIAKAPTISADYYTEFIGVKPVTLSVDDTYTLVQQATIAIVASGTATLETALLGTPEIVCYMANPVSVWLAKRLVKIKFVSLVNLIAQKEVVRELIQQDFTKENLILEINKLLHDKTKIAELESDYKEIYTALGDGTASKKAAEIILKFIS
jgi:lipid-A-disaccharide synthase